MWYNPIIIWLMRSPLHGIASKSIMLITYTGRKSGLQHTTPVNYMRIADHGQPVLYTTSYRQRVWWRNLRGGADVVVRLRGRGLPAQAQLIEEVDAVVSELDIYLRQAPQVGRYIGVNMGANGEPDASDLRRAAEKMVVIKSTAITTQLTA
ncbi:MAG: nitroreductase/quinone reductase family protein [Anaerolineales bacterium]